jgi:hypothetical protein
VNAERYAAPLPQLTGEVATLAACVGEHLAKMAFSHEEDQVLQSEFNCGEFAAIEKPSWPQQCPRGRIGQQSADQLP